MLQPLPARPHRVASEDRTLSVGELGDVIVVAGDVGDIILNLLRAWALRVTRDSSRRPATGGERTLHDDSRLGNRQENEPCVQGAPPCRPS